AAAFAGGPSKRGAEKQPAIALTKRGLQISVLRVESGRTTKADLEKLLRPLERALKHELRRDPIGFWDTKGVRIYFAKDTGVVDYLDCVLVPDRGQPGPEEALRRHPESRWGAGHEGDHQGRPPGQGQREALRLLLRAGLHGRLPPPRRLLLPGQGSLGPGTGAVLGTSLMRQRLNTGRRQCDLEP